MRPPNARSFELASAAGLLVALALACGGGESEALERARGRIERGDLATAAAALQGVEGAQADALRARIGQMELARTELTLSIERAMAQAVDAATAMAARDELQRLRRGHADPVSLDRIDQALSDLARAKAEGNYRSPRTAVADAPVRAADSPSRVAGEAAAGADPGESLAREALVEARRAQAERRWTSGLSHAAQAAGDPRAAADARLVQASILSAALVEAEELLANARRVEADFGPAAARDELTPQLARFPSSSEFDRLRSQARSLAERAARGGSTGGPGRPAVAHRPAAPEVPAERAPARDGLERAASIEELALIAGDRAKSGDLHGSREAWLEGLRRNPSAVARAELAARIRELDRRIALREELADFARLDTTTAAILGLGSSPQAQDPGFGRVAPADLQRAAQRAQVSAKARLGACIESILRGDESTREAALLDLGRAAQRGEIDAADASVLVARARGTVSEGGFAFVDGNWIPATEARGLAAADAEREAAAEQARAVAEFRRATAVAKSAVLERLRSRGDPGLLEAALLARFESEWEAVERSPNLRPLVTLAEARRELDGRRTHALDLIFDEERYFYPYNPPECPPDKAAGYAAVQREVDVRVGALRDVWTGAKRVRIHGELREALASLRWLAEQAAADGVELPSPPEALRFVLALPEQEEVGLREFAWDPAERARLDEWDRIEARNERLWTALDRAPKSPARGEDPLADPMPGTEEREQVRITNAYRRMLGRRALSWHPRVQQAAQLHSDYMANSGEFSHFESGDPTRRTPFDRMRLCGYAQGVSENISMGHGDPKSAHEGWTRSSGHHRNLLAADHREMASALASQYWTQNFGVDTAFLTDL